MLHLAQELLRLRADVHAARRLHLFTVRQCGYDPNCKMFVTPVALDVAARAIDEASEAVDTWLNSQIIGLYGSDTTTNNYLERRLGETDVA